MIRNRDRYPDLTIEGVHYFAGTQRKNKGLHQQKEELQMLKELFREIKETEGFVLHKLEYGPGLPDDREDPLSGIEYPCPVQPAAW